MKRLVKFYSAVAQTWRSPSMPSIAAWLRQNAAFAENQQLCLAADRADRWLAIWLTISPAGRDLTVP